MFGPRFSSDTVTICTLILSQVLLAPWIRHQVIAGAHGKIGALSTTKIAMHAGKHGMMDEHGLKG
jgi:hypothetical protein